MLRPSPFSDVYITATFVEGEFIVPVSDHPMAWLGCTIGEPGIFGVLAPLRIAAAIFATSASEFCAVR